MTTEHVILLLSMIQKELDLLKSGVIRSLL